AAQPERRGGRGGASDDRRDRYDLRRRGDRADAAREPRDEPLGQGRDERPEGERATPRVVAAEGLDDVRVQTRPGLLAEDVDRLLVRGGGTVGTSRGDRIE